MAKWSPYPSPYRLSPLQPTTILGDSRGTRDQFGLLGPAFMCHIRLGLFDAASLCLLYPASIRTRDLRNKWHCFRAKILNISPGPPEKSSDKWESKFRATRLPWLTDFANWLQTDIPCVWYVNWKNLFLEVNAESNIYQSRNCNESWQRVAEVSNTILAFSFESSPCNFRVISET